MAHPHSASRVAPRLACLVAGVLAIGLVPALPGGIAAAQGSGDGFLFREPTRTIVLRGGFAHASAGSDIFTFATDQLTLGSGDFSGPTFGADLAVQLTPRLDVVVGASYAGRSARSEFRDWVDQDDRPIEQTTKFRRVPVTASAKLYLMPRGRTIGRFVWLPARYAPYVGVGGGAMWYRFSQEGDFVDFETLDVFSDELESSGWTGTAHAMAGLDFALTPRLGLTGEARYTYAKATLGDDFEGFDKIDLSGISTTIGLSIRF